MNLRDLYSVATKFKGKIFKKKNQINLTVTTRTCFFGKNRPERFQVQDWYPNQKMVVVPACWNGRYCSSECVDVVSY